MKFAPPTDAEIRRARNTQVYLQRGIESDVAQRILESNGALQEWERDYLQQLHQECKSWQEGTRSRIDNRLSLARDADIERLRARDEART